MLIRTMREADLDFAASCTLSEGWISETREVFGAFHVYQPEGCFIAEVGEQRAGICVTTRYGRSAFVGQLIVLPEYRGKGLGTALMQHAIGTLERFGVRNILLDGVPLAVSLYERLGFRKLARSLRFLGTLCGASSPHVRAMRSDDLDGVSKLDQEAFGGDRRFFIERRLQLYPDLCRVLEEEGEIVGYVLGQPVNGGLRVGPWVARAGAQHAGELPPSLLPLGQTNSAGLGVLETNTPALSIIREMGFQQRENPPWRMVRGPSGALASSNWLYAVGSAAKG